MKYTIVAESITYNDVIIKVKDSNINFGTTVKTEKSLPNPAELFLSSFAVSVLKNVERFSDLMKFTYNHAKITVNAARLENTPRMEDINYVLTIYSSDKTLNKVLLKKNIEKFGTIFNTAKTACEIEGKILIEIA